MTSFRILSVLVICLYIPQSSAFQNDTNCGLQRPDLDPEINIIGGKDSQVGEWPWQGLLYEENNAWCGVALITPEWAVTTAFCIDLPKYPSIYQVIFGLHNLTNVNTGNEQAVNVSEIFMHPNFTHGQNDWNIALLKLETPVELNDYVKTVCVPTKDMESMFPAGTMSTITGWGETERTQYSAILQEAQMPLVDQSVCRDQFPFDYITDNMICAGVPGSGVDSCVYDSGGPMVTNVDDRWYLTGLILSEFCGSEEYGVFTEITAYQDWMAPIFDGKDPETTPECTYDEFTCPEGWCADYCQKCNGYRDGCIYGGDESYCDGSLELFDPFPFQKLSASSIISSFPVADYTECAVQCLEAASGCLAFDVMAGSGAIMCSLANSTFYVEDNFGDVSLMHFEIEKMPLPSSTTSSRCGKLSTPIWLLAYEPIEPPQTTFTWTLEPPPTGFNPGIAFDVTVLEAGDTDCSDPNKSNTVTFKSGPGGDVMESFCLDTMPSSVEVKGSSITVEFETVDAYMYGFVLEYTAVSECSAKFTDPAPANITSPNYPEDYPDNSYCEVRFQAPVGHNVMLTVYDFQMEESPSCAYDSLSVYNGASDNATLLVGAYCGISIPMYFLSHGQDLLLVFKSDSSVNYRGYNIQYQFVEDGSDCGVQRPGLDPEINIVGGKDAQRGEWPWQGFLYEDVTGWCGASLLTPEWAVTTGFCIDLPKYPSLYTVAFGLHNLDNTTTGNEQIVGVSEIFTHPNYEYGENDWNIVLLRLSKPVIISEYVKTVCVPTADMGSAFTAGTVSTISGWGQTDKTEYSTILQEAQIPIVDQTVCSNQFPDGYITDNMMCGGIAENGIDSCSFDSGGPMVVDIDGRWYLSGIILSEFCARYEGLSGIYTRVTAFEDWLAPIFEGDNPETIAECTYDEYICPEGWCADYCTKCNGALDGCIYGGDESYCDGQLELFDPYPFVKLRPGTVAETLPVADYAECAQLCIDSADGCRAFDVTEEDGGDITCSLAKRTFEIDDNYGVLGVMHFEIEKMPLPSSSPLQRRCGKLASPLWLPAYEQPDPPVNQFTWTLQPPLSGYNPGLLFSFTRIDAGDTDCNVPDKTNTLTFRSGTDWSVTTCLTDLPQSVSYEGLSIEVEFDTVDPEVYGFILEFSAVSECSANITNSTAPVPGTITTPYYPDDYPNNANCKIFMQAPDAHNVLLTMQDFDVEDSFTCEYDSLTIYDSDMADEDKVIGKYCGTSIPSYFASSGRDMLAVFTSDESVNYKGFSAQYEFIEANPCDNTFYDAPDSFTSPGYPVGYPVNSFCQTRITVEEGNRVLLLFRDFNLEQDFAPNCQSDFDTVRIYDSNAADEDSLIAILCGPSLNEEAYVSTGRNMLVIFKSDSSQNARGFDANFYSVPDTSGCDEVHLIAPNSITSPNYPEDYPGGSTCSNLIVAPEGSVVRLTVIEFILEGEGPSGCTFDRLSIYDSNVVDDEYLIGTYCGTEIPDRFLSSNNSMLLVLETDPSVNFRGFEVLYEFQTEEEAGCDYTFTKAPGLFNSPSYPSNYPSGSTCRTLIVAPVNEIIRLTIMDFQLEPDFQDNCASNYDTLSIYDADSEDPEALIGVFCGNTINGFFETTGSRMYVVFKSDASVVRRGFQATFTFQNGPLIPTAPPPIGDPQCGRQTIPLEPETNIVGGKPAQEAEWPWQAGLWISNDVGGLDLRCGATILAPDWVITSARCLDVLNDPTVYTISAGTNTITPLSSNVQLRGVSDIYVHPDASKENYDNDIALLMLDAPFTINDYVRTACPAPKDWEYYFDEGLLCTVTGWGRVREGGITSNDLLEVDVPIYNQASCGQAYGPEEITDNMICAGYTWGGSDACQGDEGGPLVSQANGQWYLVGVVSWHDYDCARESQPGVYTKITAYEDWIAPIFEGGVPDRKEGSCAYDELQCSDGWCIDYSEKCDGDVGGRGCYYGDDERYCDEATRFFDVIGGLELTPSSIRETTNAQDVSECSQRCLNSTNIVCLAFDFSNGLCKLAIPGFTTRPTTDEATVHFQIEKMPCPGSTITDNNGRIATSKWLPNCDPSTIEDFFWVIQPPVGGEEVNSISITFRQIHNGNPALDCSTPELSNVVIFRSGPSYLSPTIGQFCLNELPENFVIPSTVGRVEFFTEDSTQYGFLADYELIWTCDDVLDDAPGVFSTPNYPEPYPTSIQCKTRIVATPGMQVILYWRDFELESGGFDCQFDWDNVKVYDGPDESSPLIGRYCGSDVPLYIRSINENLFVVFKSDSTITFRGFEAAYYNIPANFTLPSGNFTDECGKQTVVLEPESNIVGGKPAQEGEWPWQAAIYYFNTFICGGALLSPNWVVTLASCIPSQNVGYFDIAMGSSNVEGGTDNAQVFTVTEIIEHPLYDLANSRYDIALVHLGSDATITDYVRTVCIPTAEMESNFPAGTTCTVTGWGSTNPNDFGSEELLEVDVSIIDDAYCQSQYDPTPVTDEMLCAGDLDGGRGTCYGDDGGPLVSELDDTWYLLGMPSWSRGCAEHGYPAVYTRITYFEEWITDIISGNYTGDYECNQNFTEAPNTLTSPFYPENYPNDASCHTLITAPEGYFVYVAVQDFRLEDDGTLDCSRDWDTLSFYDSDRMDEERLLGSYCGDRIDRFISSTGRNMYVYFKSDGTQTERGFEVAFYFVEATGCNNDITEAPGSFTSPGYPEDYPSDTVCNTRITAPETESVFLVVQDFQLEYDDEGCAQGFDTLSVYDGDSDQAPLIGVYCYNVIPESIESTSRRIYVVFKSDASTSARGFEIAYYFRPAPPPATSPVPQPGCGVQTAPLEPEANVIGGEAQEGEWPWQIALLWNNVFVCGAALLTPDWAVTTAQCVQQDQSAYRIMIGTNNIAEWSSNYQQQPVSAVYVHPEYNSETHNFDVALLRLTDHITITDYARTICAPASDMEFETGTSCGASGWSGTDGASELLQETAYSIFGNTFCEGMTSNKICAYGVENTGACFMDEGGPLVSQVDNRWYLVGLTSKTTCGDGADVFTKMSAMYEWIAPIFDDRTPLTPSVPDLLEPIREELEAVKEDADLYMYLMYAFAGVIALTLLIAVFLLWSGSNQQKKLHKQIAHSGGTVHPDVPQETKGKTNEAYYDTVDEDNNVKKQD